MSGVSRLVALGVLLAALAAPASAPAAREQGSPLGPSRPDIVYIVADDQRWDSLWTEPNVESLIAAHAVTFENSFVVNSLCCPSRTSMLTGNYSHTTGVWNNGGAFGGWKHFDPSSTLATWLDDAGYTTGLVGKYLNAYSTPVPPGWDQWFSYAGPERYYRYTLNENGTMVSYGTEPEDYATDVFAAKAESFIRDTPADQPVFLYFAPHAPHGPATPAPPEVDAFPDLAPNRPPNYNEDDVSDKPAWLQAIPQLTESKRKHIDEARRKAYASLIAIDRAVASLIQALSDTGRLANTLVVYTSDNGLAFAEHRWRGKEVPYEESIRVPLLIRYDPLTAPRTESRLALNIDLAPTFAELALGGLPPGVSTEGRSLVPLLQAQGVRWRHDFALEHVQGHGDARLRDYLASYRDPTYCGVRDVHYTYVKLVSGEEELYDLDTDPYQLENVAGDPQYADTLAFARFRFSKLCSPLPPGM